MTSNLDAFIRECVRHPLLTPEEELILGRQVQASLPLIEEAKTRALTTIEQRTVRVGNKAKERMITANLRLVIRLAAKYERVARQLTTLDLVQEGCLGLVRAVEKFDPTRGYKFSTYSFWWIRQAISRALNQMDRDIRIPYAVADRLPRLALATQRLAHELGRSPTRKELAADVEMPEAELALLISRNQRVTSLDKHFQDDGISLVDLLPDPKTTIDNAIYTYELDQLKHALKFLDDEERLLVCHRYEIDGAAKMTLKAWAKSRGCSRQHATDVQRRAINKLRRAVTSLAFTHSLDRDEKNTIINPPLAYATR
jgi:RNA polymerase sigma factor (sigma-70 family)